MKKILLTILPLASMAGMSNAQTFTPSTDSIEATYNINEGVSDFIYIHNGSGASLNLNYETLVNTIDPIGWSNLLCTNLGCNGYVPAAGTFGTIMNGADGYLDLHVNFFEIVGTGEIKIRVYEAGNTSNADTVLYRYHVLSTAGISSIDSQNSSLSQNYPNPLKGETIIPYNLTKVNGRLVIRDHLGRILFQYDLSDVSGEFLFKEQLSSGLYFYSLYENDKIIGQRIMVVE